MQNFRTKLFGFAGAVAVFTGMAYGQITCSTLAVSAPGSLRGEGQTELLPPLFLTCSSTGNAAGVPITIQLFTQPTLTFTSQVITAATGTTEAVATAGTAAATAILAAAPGTGPAAPVAAPGTPGNAVVSNALTFTVAAPVATAGQFFVVRLDNVRVNATTMNTVVGAAPQLLNTVTYTQSGTSTSSSVGTPTLTAFVQNAFTAKYAAEFAQSNANKFATNNTAAGVTANGSTNTFSVCGSINNSSTSTVLPNFFVQVQETFNTAFKDKPGEGSGIGGDATNSGTRIKVNFANVPTGFNIFVPVTIKSENTAGTALQGAGVITAQASETGSTSTAPAAVTTPTQFNSTSTVPGAAGSGYYQVPVSSGTASIIYEITTADPAVQDNYNIPVFFQVAGNVVPSGSTSVSVQTSLAPITAATTIPSFALGSSTSSPTTLINFAQCQTSLLFPFVTNASGFETGIAISNASKDPFASATAQTGLCQLSFYGQGATPVYNTVMAPNPNEGGTAAYLSGETYSFTLTQALASTPATGTATNPATFTGYMIANCKFQYAHGFAYILYGNLGASTADTMGYLAVVLNRGTSTTSTTFGIADSIGN